VFGEQAQEVAAVAVSPIHHWGDGEAASKWGGCVGWRHGGSGISEAGKRGSLSGLGFRGLGEYYV
jgi:hypothetical protein